MSKLKRKVYSASLRLGWAFYKWSLDKYWEEEDKLWNPLDEKKENTDRMIANAVATLYDVPVDMIHSQGHNHKPKEKNDGGYEVFRQPVNGGLVGIRRPIEKEKKEND